MITTKLFLVWYAMNPFWDEVIVNVAPTEILLKTNVTYCLHWSQSQSLSHHVNGP